LKRPKILAIRFARLGDVILLLPALALLKQKFPNSELVLLTGQPCAPIAEMCPAVDHVIAVDRLAMRDGPIWRALWDMVALIRDVRCKHFDIVVDFHSFRETNLLTWLSGASVRIGLKRYRAPYLGFCFNTQPVAEDKRLHVAEMFRKVADSVPSDGEVAAGVEPAIRVVPENTSRANVVLFVDAPVPERIWPAERFAAVADFVIEKLNAEVTVVSSKEKGGLAARVRMTSRNREKLAVRTDLSLPDLARVIAGAQLLISNDTGPMHLGPAIGVPTLGLFSVGYPEHFRPIGSRDRFLRANPIEQIQVEDVVKTVEEMWVIADRDLRR
jgi:ADP-heptose:LPS heptosyltransferase